MVYKTIDVGNYGQWRIVVQQTSQSYSDNTSKVRVIGILYNTGTVGSYANASITKQIRGEDSWDGSGGFDVPAGDSQTIIDKTFTVPHDSDGDKKVTYRVYYGATGTYTFGTPGWVEVSLTLDRIPKPPNAPSTPSRSFAAPTTMTISWGAPDNNGASIDEYQLQYDDNSRFSSPSTVSTGTSRSKAVTVGIGKTWYFRVRARNAQGWGSWSSATSYGVPNVPNKVGALYYSYTPATTMALSWPAPGNNGATITRYLLQYADNPSFYGVKSKYVTGTSTSVSDLVVGKTWYFRVQAENSQGGGAWSDVKSYLVVCGPRVLVNGSWRNTVAYVNVNGVWKTAIPYVNVSGTYKVAGG